MTLKNSWMARAFVYVLCLMFGSLTLQGTRRPAAAAARATETSREAAAFARGSDGEWQGDEEGAFTLRGWQPTATFMAGCALADTTEVEFPEEGEKHLVRELLVFGIVAAFVGFFIAEIFLNEDTEETAEDDGGKDIPTTGPAR